MSQPRITFGIIVLNGEPFTRYTLRALYPFAHEIIVVEGAAPAAANVATPDGHSQDGTLETLRLFKAEEDTENKLKIVTKDGFWIEKDEMSQAYAARATGDYLWQVDVDEFYLPQDMQKIIDMLRDDPKITAVSFKTVTFWGSPDIIVDGWYLRRGGDIFHRLFKWEQGYKYVTHRPPTVCNAQGVDLRDLRWIKGEELARCDIFMYHYSLLLPKQVLEKSAYYGQAYPHHSGGNSWAHDHFMRLSRPFHVHNVYKYPSWLEHYRSITHPQIQHLWQELPSCFPDISLRPASDAQALLDSSWYQWARSFVKKLDRPALFLRRWYNRLRKAYALLTNGLKH